MSKKETKPETAEVDADGLAVQRYRSMVLVVVPAEAYGDESLRYADRDQTIRTALLEARYLWGDRELFDELIKAFAQRFTSGDGRDFVEAKLAERDQRHQRMGDSRYVVEPNVKEGKGGLRDLHLLFWIAKYLYRVDSPAELLGVLARL